MGFGYVLMVYLKLPVMAVAILGVMLAILYYNQNNTKKESEGMMEDAGT